jgi:leucine dehydrogenase
VATFEELLERWDGEQVVIRRDRESGGWIFICLHSTRLGPAAGGTRLKVYETPADGLADAMRLSAAMTAKLAIAGMGYGGGKTVLAVPEIPGGDRRRALLRRYGDLVASLGGSYVTSSDVNTGDEDMDVIAERTENVFGRTVANGGAGNPGPTRRSASITGSGPVSATSSARPRSKGAVCSSRAPAASGPRWQSGSAARAPGSRSRMSTAAEPRQRLGPLGARPFLLRQ